MKHIVIISTSYPTEQDGSEAAGSFVADFVATLSEKQRVTVIAPGLEDSEQRLTENLKVIRFKVPRLPLSLLKAQNPGNWPAIFKTLRTGRQAVNEVMLTANVDYIFALWVLPSGYWAKQAAERYQIPYSTWALGSDIWNLGKIPVIRHYLQVVLKASQTNYADGYQLKDSVESLSDRQAYFLPSTRNLPIQKTKDLRSAPPYRLAFLGRWHPNKGIDILMESLNFLKEADWQNIEAIHIAGGGVLERYVHQAVEVLQQQGRPVAVSGYMDKTAAIELLYWADYVLIPSRIESIPVIFSDAMKCQCPVVCMPVGDLPRLLSEYSVGELANALNAGGFVEALSHILVRAPIEFQAELQLAAEGFTVESSVSSLLERLA